MSVLNKRERENMYSYEIYEGLAPGRGELLYALMRDDVSDFKKYFKSQHKDELISGIKFFNLLIESNSFNCILYFQKREKKYVRNKPVGMKKEILKRLFISDYINEQEIDDFLKIFLKCKWTKEEKIQLYITALIYAPKNIFIKYFEKNYKYIENKNLLYIMNVFENNNILSTKNYFNNINRLHLIYEQILKIGKKRSVNWLHYVNSTFLGSENEIFRVNFFEYLPHKEKMKWVNYLFKHLNLIYHSTILVENIEDKYSIKNKNNEKNLNLNLDFVVFIFDNILSYLKSNQIDLTRTQIKKLILFRNTLDSIANNVFLFSSIIVFKDLDNYIHEWNLRKELSKIDKKICPALDRKKKKI